MRIFSFMLCLVFLGAQSTVSAGVWAQISALANRKNHTIVGFHEHCAALQKTPQQLAQSLVTQKITPQQYLHRTYRNQYQKIFNAIELYAVPLLREQAHSSIVPGFELYTPTIISQGAVPEWVTHELSCITQQLFLPVREVIVRCGTKSTSAGLLDPTKAQLSFCPTTLRIGEAHRNRFTGVALHELAHIALRHGRARSGIERACLSSSLIDPNDVLKNLYHLQEFEADNYFTAQFRDGTQGLLEYLTAIAHHYNDYTRESDTHPSLSRRIKALIAQRELIKHSPESSLD